jgi:hypothetical protein
MSARKVSDGTEEGGVYQDPENSSREGTERRISDAITRHELHAETRYATKAELASVSAALHSQGLDVVKLQLELEGIRKSLDQISSNLNRVVWIVLTAVLLAGIGLVVRPDLPL